MGSAPTGVGVDALLSAIPELLPEAAGDPDARAAGPCLQDRAGTRRRSCRLRAALRRARVHARDRLSFGDGAEGRRHHLRRHAARRARAAAAARRARSRSWSASAASASATRSGRQRAPTRSASSRHPPWSPWSRRSTRRWRPAPGRAERARGAGPADQRPPGRRARRDLRLALRRGPEGGHRRDAGTDYGVECRFRGPPRSASSGRSAPARRSRCSKPRRTRSWPRSACGSTGAGRPRILVPARRRARRRAVVHLQDAHRFGDLMAQYVRETLEEGLYG